MSSRQKKAKRLLACPLCLEPFESPKLLACFHTFCEKCISKEVTTLQQEEAEIYTYSCPICRCSILLSSSDQSLEDYAARLPTNSYILTATDQRNISSPVVYCQPCILRDNQKAAAVFCVTCSEHLCDVCYDYHKHFKMSKNHSVVPMATTETAHGDSYMRTTSAMYYCFEHHKSYQYYCFNHVEVCCCVCALQYHRKCDEIILIKDLPLREKESIFSMLKERLATIKSMFEKLFENKLQNIESIEQQRTAIAMYIQNWCHEIKEHIAKLETEVLEELKRLYKSESMFLLDQVMEGKSILAAIKVSEEMLKRDENGDEDKIFVVNTKLSKQVTKYMEQYYIMENKSENIELVFHLDHKCEEMFKALMSMGAMDRKVSKLAKPLLGTASTLKHCTSTFGVIVSDDQKTCDVWSGIFLHDSRLLLCDNANDKLKLFDQKFQYVSHLNLQDPRYICTVDETTAAVSASDGVDFVAVDKSLTVTRRITTGKMCYGIASYHNNIVVSIYGDSLLTFDSSGRMIDSIKRYDWLGLHNSHCISADGQLIYYTTKNCIVTMDTKGKRLHTFESADLKRPYGIILDKNGTIYCCGGESKTVIIYSPHGEQIRLLLSRDHGLVNPYGICVNSKNNIMVVFEGNSNILKVFMNVVG